MRKKRALKVILLGVVILFIVAGTGLYVYSHYFTLHPAVESQLREQFGDAFFDEFNDLEEEEPEPEQIDPDKIVERYEHRFEGLEERANERLEELFEEAVADYRRQKAESTLDRFEFVNKYIQAGRMLESRVDEVFYELLSEMEAELIKGGHSLEILEEIEATYKQAKEEKKRQLLQRLRQEIGE